MGNQWPALKARDMVRLLQRELGYAVARQEGSYRTMVADGRPPITFAFHDEVTIRPRVVGTILVQQIGLSLEEARELINAASAVIDLVIVSPGEDEDGWAVYSPQLPDFSGGRTTLLELRRDLPQMLSYTGINPHTRIRYHREHLYTMDGVDYVNPGVSGQASRCERTHRGTYPHRDECSRAAARDARGAPQQNR